MYMNITRHLYAFTFQFQVLVILKINEEFNNSLVFIGYTNLYN